MQKLRPDLGIPPPLVTTYRKCAKRFCTYTCNARPSITLCAPIYVSRVL